MALGRVGPPRRAIAASSAPEGEKVRNVAAWSTFCSQSLRDSVVDPNLVIEHEFWPQKQVLHLAVLEKSRVAIFN